MPTPILMPALSPTMEEGKLAKWLVKEGQKVRAGDIIAEIETDKATMEVEAVDEGTVGRLLIHEGTDKVKVNTPIAMLLEEGENASALTATTAAPSSSATTPSTSQKPAAGAGSSASPVKPAKDEAAPHRQMAGSAPARPNGHAEARVFASPLARRLAKDGKLDLARMEGSGPHGRIVKRDVEAALKGGGNQRTPAAPVQSTAITTSPATASAIQAMPDDKVLALYETGNYEVVPHDGMRRVIAQRLTQSKQTIPHFYMSVDCRLDTLLAARERINKIAPKDGPRAYKLSVNDFVIKALALALQQVPAANATWTEAGMLRHRHSDVGVAVAVEGGLFTPVIHHAELKTLGEISNEMKDLAERARKRRLAPHEYQGGTTSISNLGMYGIKAFDAVINPPHATILAVGAGEKRAVVNGDRVEVATIMTCTLSCDHRVVDGAVGADLLNAFRALVEDPVRMLV
ncbi:MAG: pyruvate dehydrogenase complex dihydrolipoamide acetyltransferase [Sphingomonadales bacterium]|nr:pyruvate dehydrogenase complex dihydrolipoamide acetyltransferase [Sphingomonadales bacterium]